MKRFRPLLIAIASLIGGCATKDLGHQEPDSVAVEESQASAVLLNKAVNQQDYVRAERIVEAMLIQDPDNVSYLHTAAFVYGKQGQSEKAAEMLCSAVHEGCKDASTINLAIRANLEVGRLFESIELLQAAIEQSPDDVALRRTLIGFLGEAQMTDEIPTHLLPLIRARKFDVFLLETVVLPGRRFSVEQMNELSSRNPGDLRLKIAEAAVAFDAVDFEQTVRITKPIVDQHPQFKPASGLYGRSLAMLGQEKQLAKWRESIGQTELSADGYFALSRYYQEHQQLALSVEATAKAIELRPNDPTLLAEMTMLLKQMDADIDQNEQVTRTLKSLEDRRELLAKLLVEATSFSHDGHDDPIKAMAVARTLDRLGRRWEAEAWSAVAVALVEASDVDEETLEELEATRKAIVASLSLDTPWQSEVDDLLPMPRIQVSKSLRTVPETREALVRSRDEPVQLRESSEEFGLTYNGHTGPLRFGPMVPLSDSLGCGAGALDFDLDGQTDLYLAAAGGTINENNSDQGALLRMTDTRLADVTRLSGLSDSGFGQGVAVADYNQDGFDDVYVLNFGENRLYRNNGDGTFQLTVGTSALSSPQWSSSGAWADFNGDGYLDLFVCNYIDDDDQVAKVCFDSSGKPAPCSPLDFLAAANRCYAGMPDGSFEDVTESWRADPEPGRSLAVLAGRLNGSDMGLFVANDMSSNVVLVSPKQSDRATFEFVDQSFLSGLAVDGRGRTQASMGMAADDFDHDGDLDFFVTGFEDEYHVLYRQETPGLWVDQTTRARLVTPTMNRVGFGAKAIDFDNDGFSELFVTNGHVSGGSASGAPYAQPADLWRESKTGAYAAIKVVERDSDYFQHPHVGRCLIPMDANRDGRLDLLVTHMTEPPSLVVNETQVTHPIATLQLVGKTSERSAVGSIVSLSLETDQGIAVVSKQLLGGNGYQVSTPRMLVFAFGDAPNAKETTVQWANGQTQTLPPLEPGHHYVCVQGQGLYDTGLYNASF